MTTLDPTTCRARLQRYLDAESKILDGQSVRFGERMLTMANLDEVRQGIKDCDADLQIATQTAAGTRRSVTVAPTF